MDVDKLEAGRELDALVAEKVMEWKLVDSVTDEVVVNISDYEEAAYNDGWHWEGRAGRFEAWQWNPSADIAPAWEVVEKLDSPDLFIALETGTCAGQHVWWCTFWDGDERHYSAAADTSQLAICRAALKVVGGMDGR